MKKVIFTACSLLLCFSFCLSLYSCKPSPNDDDSLPEPYKATLKPASQSILNVDYTKPENDEGLPVYPSCFAVSEDGKDVYFCDTAAKKVLHYKDNELVKETAYKISGSSDGYPSDIMVSSNGYYLLIGNVPVFVAFDGTMKSDFVKLDEVFDPESPDFIVMQYADGLFVVRENDDTHFLSPVSPLSEAVDILRNKGELRRTYIEYGESCLSAFNLTNYDAYSIFELIFLEEGEADGTIKTTRWIYLVDDSHQISKVQIPNSILYTDISVRVTPNGNVYIMIVDEKSVDISLAAQVAA